MIRSLQSLRGRLRYAIRQAARARGYEVVQLRPGCSLSAQFSLLERRHGINCVLDVGAHTGEFGLFLRQNGYRGHLISFEPSRESFELLRSTARRDPRWHVYQVALGAHAEQREMHIANATVFNSFLAPSDYGVAACDHGIQTHHTELIEVVRLDEIFADVRTRSMGDAYYLKMDTQGWDLEVVNGATRVLNLIPGLQSEVSIRPLYEGMPTYLESLARLRELGYELDGLFPVVWDQQKRIIEFDCVMSRRELR